jgi:hypothetical protein
MLCFVAVIVVGLCLPKFLKYDGREGVLQREFEEEKRAQGFS